MKKQQKRKGFEWYRMLTKKQQKQFRKECIKEEPSDCGWFQYSLNRVDTLYGFLTGSIIFSKSEKGSEYWNRIAKLNK